MADKNDLEKLWANFRDLNEQEIAEQMSRANAPEKFWENYRNYHPTMTDITCREATLGKTTGYGETAVTWTAVAAAKGLTYPDGKPLLVTKGDDGKEADLAWARTASVNMGNADYVAGLAQQVRDSLKDCKPENSSNLYNQALAAWAAQKDILAASKGYAAKEMQRKLKAAAPSK